MAAPVQHLKPVPKGLKKVDKHPKPFKRFHSDRYARVGESWRKPRGIDNRVRRRFRGTIKMPSIGFRTDKRTRYLLPCGLRKFVVKNEDELNMLIMHNNALCAEIAHSVSARKRKSIVARAEMLNIHITNKNAKLHEEEAQ